ncbi:MAG: hypothetical protein AB7I24_18250 [Candidatus Nanopelagicales bacterium]
MRRCEACGTPIAQDRPRKTRFCDSSCRSRFHRGTHQWWLTQPEVVEDGDEDDLTPPTLEEIAQLLAATILDHRTPASALARLAREYRATLEAIEAKAPRVPADAVDELLARRLTRGGAS